VREVACAVDLPADAGWVPKGRNDDGENASTSMLLAASATKSNIVSDDEGEKKDLMMIDEMEEKRRIKGSSDGWDRC
jgi:hypothetical protein